MAYVHGVLNASKDNKMCADLQQQEEAKHLLSIALSGLHAAGSKGADIAVLPESFSGLLPQTLDVEGGIGHTVTGGAEWQADAGEGVGKLVGAKEHTKF